MSHDAHDDVCMTLSQDDLEMGRCPRGAMCDCYWCPHCQEPHAGFIGCEPDTTCAACGVAPLDGTPCACFSTTALSREGS